MTRSVVVETEQKAGVVPDYLAVTRPQSSDCRRQKLLSHVSAMVCAIPISRQAASTRRVDLFVPAHLNVGAWLKLAPAPAVFYRLYLKH